MKHTHTPDDASPFKGRVVVREPTFDEICDLGMAVSAAEAGHTTEEQAKLAASKVLVRASAPYYEEIALVHKASGDEVTTFEGLQQRREAWPLLAYVGVGILRGFPAPRVDAEGTVGNAPTP